MADQDHDHEIKIKGGSFELSDLGHLLPGMAEIMPLVGERIWKCYYAGKAGNAALARFHLSGPLKLIEKGAIPRPKYSDAMGELRSGIVAAIRTPIQTQGWDSFREPQ